MLLFLLVFAVAARQASSFSCNVLDYGAKGDGKTDDTKAIQAAIHNCSEYASKNSLGATVVLPSNHTFVSFPLTLESSNLEFVVDTNAVLSASTDIDGWPLKSNGKDYANFLSGANIDHVNITGHGVIDGNGQPWWQIYKNNTLQHTRPKLIYVSDCQSLLISGLTLLNSPSFNVYADKCDGVVIHHLNISAPSYSTAPNTDGIDIGSANVHVYDCVIRSGDDSYVLKAGATNVLIENSSIVLNGLGLDVGTGADPPIDHCVFRNMVVSHAEWAIRVKDKGDTQTGSVSNILFQNITFIEVQKAIDLNQFNQSVAVMHLVNNRNRTRTRTRTDTGMDTDGDDDGVHSPSIKYTWGDYGWVSIENITWDGIHGTYTEYAGHLDCSSNAPCTGLVFANIDLQATNSKATDWQCSKNVYGTATNVSPKMPTECLH